MQETTNKRPREKPMGGSEPWGAVGGEAPSEGHLWTAGSGGLEGLSWTCHRQSSLRPPSMWCGCSALGLILDGWDILMFYTLSPGSSATETLVAHLL